MRQKSKAKTRKSPIERLQRDEAQQQQQQKRFQNSSLASRTSDLANAALYHPPPGSPPLAIPPYRIHTGTGNFAPH